MVFIFVCIDIQLSRVQPPQYEMEEYILRVAEQFKLREKTRFQTEINKFEWDDVNGEWTLYAHDVKLVKESSTKVSFYLPVKVG